MPVYIAILRSINVGEKRKNAVTKVQYIVSIRRKNTK